MFFRVIILYILFFSVNVYANPSPFGITIGETTIKELKTKYKVSSDGINKYSLGEMYKIPVSQIEFQNLEDVTVIFDKNERVTAVLCKVSKHRYNQLLDMLSSKYKLLNKKDAFVGDKSATFTDDDVKIELYSPHMDFKLYLNYTHKDFDKSYEDISKKEKKEKESKESGAL